MKPFYLVGLLSMLSFHALGQIGVGSQSTVLMQAEKRYQELYSQKKYAEATPYAQQALNLALNDPKVRLSDRADLLNDLAELYYLQRKYSQAEELARRALALKQSAPASEIDSQAVAVSEEDVAQLLDLQGKFSEAAAFHQKARSALEHTRSDTVPTSALGRDDTVIKQSVLDFYDAYHAEDRGYGRYTYVLFPTGAGGCERCVRLLTALFESTPPGPVVLVNRAVVNIFEMPVINGQRDKSRLLLTHPSSSDLSSKVLAQYNFATANELLTRACAKYRELAGKFCGTLSQGPYLVMYASPVSAYNTLPHPYLIVDMSNVNPRAFHFFIEQVKKQVGSQDISDDRRITASYTRMVSLTLDVSDVLDPITKAVEQWVKIIK